MESIYRKNCIYWSYPLDEDMLQLLIIGYVIYEIIRLSNLPDAGSYALPQPQPSLPVFLLNFVKTAFTFFPRIRTL
ncbi:hypothetical protein LOAG_09060 [Loa loa]|uniref:Uncharacterized protein n=1 Tax=Loa loa TaxID=7209 RepID=A0A1S0TSU1_LOALO|nr:hypothetical protein LOAG_09060 [Loa loa]EFO19433.2 hypothetical protein LOAG_09060 [Loa loa]